MTQPAKPVSDAAGNEALLYLLGHWSEIGLMRQRQIVAEAADTIERLVKIEQRARVMLESREKATALAIRRGAKPRASDGVIWMLCHILEGDQLQGGSDK